MKEVNEIELANKLAKSEMKSPGIGENFRIWNEDCITGSKKIIDGSVKLIVCDAPFGINETKFDNLYNRDASTIMGGYVEAPQDYDRFTLEWLTECKRILHDDGSMYLVSGWSNLSSFYIFAGS